MEHEEVATETAAWGWGAHNGKEAARRQRRNVGEQHSSCRSIPLEQ